MNLYKDKFDAVRRNPYSITGDLFRPLEDAICNVLLPAITGQNAFNDNDRDLMALLVGHGGLGIIDSSSQAANQCRTSEKITAPLAALIMMPSQEYPPEAKLEQIRAKNIARYICRQQEAMAAEQLKERMPDRKWGAMTVFAEKGASSWLSTLPIADHGFTQHKGAFRDALCL